MYATNRPTSWKPVIGLMIVPLLFVAAKVADSATFNAGPTSQFVIKVPQPRSILLAPYTPNPYEAALASCNATPNAGGVGDRLTTCGAIVMEVFKHQAPRAVE